MKETNLFHQSDNISYKFLIVLFNISQVKFSLHDLMLEIVEALVESFLSN